MGAVSTRPKIAQLTFQLFDRIVHPELFDHCAHRSYDRDAWKLDVDITTSGHVLHWTDGTSQLCEVAASAHQPLPAKRRMIDRAITGNINESLVYGNSVKYENDLEIESVDTKTFASVQHEVSKMSLFDGIMHKFESSGRLAFGAVSYINVEQWARQVRIRAFHTFPDDNALLKSVSIITLL